MGQKHQTFWGLRTSFPPRDVHKKPRSKCARVSQEMAQFVLKIEKLSHILGTAPIVELARARGLHPRLWLLMKTIEQLFHVILFIILHKVVLSFNSMDKPLIISE